MAEKTFERTPKDLIIGIAMTLCGGVLWGVNATVSKILMGTYHASPHVSCSGSRSQTVRGRAEEVENLVHIRSDHRVRHGEDLVQRLAVPYFFD